MQFCFARRSFHIVEMLGHAGPLAANIDPSLFTFQESALALETLVNLTMGHDTAIYNAAVLVCVYNADWSILLVLRLRIFLPFLLLGAFPENGIFEERTLTVAVINAPMDSVAVAVAVRIPTLTGREGSSLGLFLCVVDIDFERFDGGITGRGFTEDVCL
jgi:hypothetical protein